VPEEVTWVEGNYRLREAERGDGIFTYDMMNGRSYALSQDFVDVDSNFTDANAIAGVSVHWAAEATYDYYLAKHGRNSFDNKGGRIVSYVHFDDQKSNAFWDGTRASYGDGIGNETPWVTIDIVGHEITHGVNEHSANLFGAIAESFCDIFGESIEFYLKGDGPDWLVGGEIGAHRSFSNPNAFNHPDTYLGNFWNYIGSLHINTGVQNYWFYLLSKGGSGVNDNGDIYSVTGVGLEDAGQIAYRNLTVYLQPTSDYYAAGRYSVRSAIDLFGDNSAEHNAVLDAWFAVGIYIEPKIEVSSDTLIFSLEIENADTSQIIISNKGLDTLKILDIQISGTNFQLTDTLDFPFNLDHKDNFTLNVEFSTTTLTVETDTLNLFSNDPRTPIISVILFAEEPVTGIGNLTSKLITQKYNLYQNYPNPFNPSTTISYYYKLQTAEGTVTRKRVVLV